MRLAVSILPACAPCFHNSSGLPLHTPLRLIRDGHSRHGLDGSHVWENDCQRINYIVGILLTASRCCARAHEQRYGPLTSHSDPEIEVKVQLWSNVASVYSRFFGSHFGSIQSIDAPMFRNNQPKTHRKFLRYFREIHSCWFSMVFYVGSCHNLIYLKVFSSHIW